MRIKKLHILILKAYFGPFLATFFIAVFVLLMQFLWKYVDDLVGKGIDSFIIAQLMFYASSTFVPLALPLAILLSSIMTFGNLGEHSELTAMKASGISLQKMMRPLIVTSILISLSAFYFSNNIYPIANLKMKSLLYDVRQQKPALNIKEGIFFNGIDGYVIKVKKKDSDGQGIRGILIYNHTSKSGKLNVTVAEKGKMVTTDDKRFLIFTLENGSNFVEQNTDRKNSSKFPLQRTKFSKQEMRFDLSPFSMSRTNEDLFKNNYQMLNVTQLNYSLDTLSIELNKRKKEILKYALKRYFFLNIYLNADKHILDSMRLADQRAKAKNDSMLAMEKKYQLPGAYDDNSNLPLPPKPTIQVNSSFKIDSNKITPEFIYNFPKDKQLQVYEASITAAKGQKEYCAVIKDEISGQVRYLNKHRIELQRKFTLSFACLILFFIGAPLGAIIKRGGLGLPLVVSVLLFVMYHVISITGEKMVREDIWNVYYGMWLASGIFLPLGIMLTIKATTDAPMFDLDSYKMFFKKIVRKRN